jgi:GntR family transcriptional regulator / MocR family aminotransferase
VLARHLPDIQPSGDSAGLHLLLRLPDGRDPDQVATLAAKHDVQLENATWHWAERCSAPPALLVGYGAQREHALAHGIEALAAEPW